MKKIIKLFVSMSTVFMMVFSPIVSACSPQPDLTITKTNNIGGGNAVVGTPFTWKLRVQNAGNATATFYKNEMIVKDNMPSSHVGTYGTVSVSASAGVTGVPSKLDCYQNGTDDADLVCRVKNTNGYSITIPAGDYIDFSVAVNPTSVGTIANPRSGSGNICDVDHEHKIDESNESNNLCSDSVNIVAAPVCGNGIKEANEQCDAGCENGIPCIPPYGSTCNYCSDQCQTVTSTGPYCGDQIKNGQEECDDGNTQNGDGCSATCLTEQTCDYKCFVPNSLNDTQSETINPNSEISLQTFLNNNGYSINVANDQTNMQNWQAAAADASLEITFLGKLAGYSHVFGYYLNGDIQTFVPLFEDAEHPLFSAPLASPGDKFSIDIDQGDTVGFAINEYSSNPQKYSYTENSLNFQGTDRVLVFDLCTQFVLGFNDSYGDLDYQDIIVSVKRISCNVPEPECIPEGGSGMVIFPQGPSCCQGLAPIGCDVPDQSGNCPTGPCAGAFYCTMCGNGICGLGENKCNCPQDCGPQPQCTDADGDGYFAEGGNCGTADCNDANADIHPGTTEICGNQIDEDCSGSDLECPPPCENVIVVSNTDDDVLDTQDIFISKAVLTWNLHTAWTAVIDSANWIWKTYQVENPTQDETYRFSKSFDIVGTVSSATLKLAADNTYKVWINDVSVGENLTEFNYTNVSEYNVTDKLQSGTNIIKFEIMNMALADSTPETNPAGLLYRLEIVRSSCEPEPSCGDGQCNGNETCGTCSEDCGSCPSTSTAINAYKIVCETEADLPNWGNGSGPEQISADTATNFVTNSQGKCSLAAGWDFQWGFNGEVSSPLGTDIGPGGTGWHNFDSSTGVSTPAQVQITDLKGISTLWFKENLKESYIPFSAPPTETQSNISAEMYCHEDIFNYDNYDYISGVQLGNTYYCAAFNALQTTPQPYCGDGIKNVDEQCDDGNIQNGDGCSATCTIEMQPQCTDVDGDGYSIEGNQCGPIDCNDSNVNIHPNAIEVCNEKDDDCDGLVDEGHVCDTPSLWYQDADGDGYGNPAVSQSAYSAPEGYVSNNTDCNDSNANIHPGATEICGNGIDEDCSGADLQCSSQPYCGDGSCNNGENCSSCSQDCGGCGGGGGGGGGGGSTQLLIFNEKLESIFGNSAIVSWSTNIPATSRVVYDTVPHALGGTPPNYGYAYSTIELPMKVTFHIMGITGLTPNTIYYWRPISHGSGEALGDESIFATVTSQTSPPIVETPGTPTPTPTPAPTPTPIPTPEEQPVITEIPPSETTGETETGEGQGMLSGLMAAVGGFFGANNLCLLLLLLILILIVLLGLTMYKSRTKEYRIWILSILILFATLLYKGRCSWKSWWILLIIAAIVGAISYYLGDKKDKGN